MTTSPSARRTVAARPTRALNGWIVLDKPLGMSSAKAVAAVRKLTGAAKAGHGGTLDPLATGVLPIALGEATKTVAFVMDGTKAYRFTVQWGESRATDDAEGEVTGTSPVRPDSEAIRSVLPRFTGMIEQRPPAYSALKLDGKRAYALARQGQTPVLAVRPVRIDRLDLLKTEPESAAFELVCGKGTYVRALARDLAETLGTLGFVAQLRRTAAGPFIETQAISLDKLGGFVHSAASFVLPVSTALDDIPALALTEGEAQRLSRGQSIPVSGPDGFRFSKADVPPSILRAEAEGRLVALVRIDGDLIRPVRVLNL